MQVVRAGAGRAGLRRQHRDHLADAEAGAFGERPVEQRTAEPSTGGPRRQIDRFLDAVPVPRPRLPGCDAGHFPAYAPNSHEFVHVLDGRRTVGVGDSGWVLAAGDTLYFEADAPHRFVNDGQSPCRYFVAAMIMRARTPGSRGRSRAGRTDSQAR
ncbi:cupin domain-containing protein [Rhodococcus sp. W8901]|nr:cupin domain-containing protein [Rhodococcus sp. W8901]